MDTTRAIKTLEGIFRIVEAGEKGYAVSAANVNNPGLKILFKSYAQQRARYKEDVLANLKRLGGDAKPRSSFRGILHRGRMDIFAAMSAGNEEREKVVLKEITVGEQAAVRTYERALAEPLPADTVDMLKRQFAEITVVAQRIKLMRGHEGKRLLVRLFNTDENVDGAIRELRSAGLYLDTLERMPIPIATDLYNGRGTTVFETSLSGAAGGALWGSLIGALAGFGADSAANLAPLGALPAQHIWPLIALAGIGGGGLVGSLLGAAIGLGISEADDYLYAQSKDYGKVILLTMVEGTHALEAVRILAHIPNPA